MSAHPLSISALRACPLREQAVESGPVITASCPSCGSGITFRSAAALTVVCDNCRSCVLRTDSSPVDLGKVAPLSRELSPLQVGCRGQEGGRSFELIGVLRKGRKGVRWNEFFLAWSDGSYGWLSDGNGEYQLFDHDPRGAGLPDPAGLPAGSKVTLGDTLWRVTESGTAELLAAEGELPFPVQPREGSRYCDMQARGKVATLDKDGQGQTLLWVGRHVELPDLQMDGLRPFAGWADEALVRFDGPEITATATLNCPNCRAPLELRAPGGTARVGCGYCGSALGASESGGGIALSVLTARSEIPFEPTLPLGTMGTLYGARWQVLGAMVRSVRADGEDWPWTEYVLWNPYRGWAWLVQDGEGHWSFAKKLHEWPESAARWAKWQGATLQAFSSGVATVTAVLGEFYWAIEAGDAAATRDYVAAPHMLSYERVQGEVSWSHGVYLPADVIWQAFGVTGMSPSGAAPHQPNPYGLDEVKSLHRNMLVVLAALLLIAGLGKAVLLPPSTALDQAFLAKDSSQNVWISQPFELPGGFVDDVTMRAQSSADPFTASLHLGVLDLDKGQAWLPGLKTEPSGLGAAYRGVVQGLPAGRYVARVELATPPDKGSVLKGQTVELRVVRGESSTLPLYLAALTLAVFFLVRVFAYGAFEGRRWANADADESDRAWRELD